MRVWKTVGAVCVAAVLAASIAERASAVGCFTCDGSLNCAGADQGAKFCLQGPLTCTLAIPCMGSGPRRAPDSPEEMTSWSLFELDGTAATGVEPEAGALSVGEAQRSAHANGHGVLVDATLAFGHDLAVILSDGAGDGFAVRRTAQAGGVRLEVLEVTGDQPGRVLADAVLGPRDKLRVLVRAGGRERLLVLQADDLPPGQARAALVHLRNSLREAGRSIPERKEPLLKARAL